MRRFCYLLCSFCLLASYFYWFFTKSLFKTWFIWF